MVMSYCAAYGSLEDLSSFIGLTVKLFSVVASLRLLTSSLSNSESGEKLHPLLGTMKTHCCLSTLA